MCISYYCTHSKCNFIELYFQLIWNKHKKIYQHFGNSSILTNKSITNKTLRMFLKTKIVQTLSKYEWFLFETWLCRFLRLAVYRVFVFHETSSIICGPSVDIPKPFTQAHVRGQCVLGVIFWNRNAVTF